MMPKLSLSLVWALAGSLALGCASSPDLAELEEMPTAEALYEEGAALLADQKSFLTLDITDYAGAIQKFQDIIDNYPYSSLAVDAELRIADAFYQQQAWEEAIT